LSNEHGGSVFILRLIILMKTTLSIQGLYVTFSKTTLPLCWLSWLNYYAESRGASSTACSFQQLVKMTTEAVFIVWLCSVSNLSFGGSHLVTAINFNLTSNSMSEMFDSEFKLFEVSILIKYLFGPYWTSQIQIW